MNKVLTLIVALATVFCPLAAFSGLIPGVEMEAGLEVGDFHYRESHIMREDGVQGGVYGSIAVLAADPLYFQFYMSFVGGDVKYDGGYGSGWSYRTLTGDTSNYIYNFRGLAGLRLGTDGFTLMPYTGIG